MKVSDVRLAAAVAVVCLGGGWFAARASLTVLLVAVAVPLVLWGFAIGKAAWVVMAAVVLAVATAAWQPLVTYVPSVLSVLAVLSTRLRSVGGGRPAVSPLASGLALWVLVASPAALLLSGQGNDRIAYTVVVLVVTAWSAWRCFGPRPVTVVHTEVLWSGAVLAAVFLGYSLAHLTSTSGTWTKVWEGSGWVNSNTLGMFLLIGLAVALARLVHGGRSAPSILMVALFGASVLLSFSRGAYVGLGVMVVLAVASRGVRGAVLVAVPVGVLVWSVPVAVVDRLSYTTSGSGLDPSSEARLKLWPSAVSVAVDHPFFGVGLHRLSAFIYQAPGSATPFSFAHSLPLTLAAGLGLVFVLLAACWLVLIMCSLMRARRRDSGDVHAGAAVLGMGGVMTASLFGESLLSPVIVIPLIALIAPLLSRPRRTPRAHEGPADSRNRHGWPLVPRPGDGALPARS